MAELGQTTQAKALIPGEPAAVRETGQRWRNMGGALASIFRAGDVWA